MKAVPTCYLLNICFCLYLSLLPSTSLSEASIGDGYSLHVCLQASQTHLVGHYCNSASGFWYPKRYSGRWKKREFDIQIQNYIYHHIVVKQVSPMKVAPQMQEIKHLMSSITVQAASLLLYQPIYFRSLRCQYQKPANFFKKPGDRSAVIFYSLNLADINPSFCAPSHDS